MKQIWNGLVITAVLSAPAMATDMNPPNHVKAPAIDHLYNWSGVYAGAHVGYNWGRARIADNGVVTENAVPMDGGVAGLLAGVNWQAGAFVYGLEGDFGVSNLRGTGTIIPPAIPPTPIVAPPNHYKVDWTGTVRARVGYTILPRTLVYVAGGLALANFEFRDGDTQNAISKLLNGWVIGGGVDHAFMSNLVGRLEYLYADYGSRDFAVAPGDIYNVGFKTQTFRGAMIWKF
jgi:outer membrane immunogenic protein